MTWITNTIARLDLNAYKADYYDPTQKASDVAYKYGISPSVQGQVIRALGWKTRKEVGCCMSRKSSNGNGHHPIVNFDETQVFHCNRHCPLWRHCNRNRPTPLPCEKVIFDDELIDSDPDSAIYYTSPFEVSIYA